MSALWKIAPQDAANNLVAVRKLNGETVTLFLSMETALEIVEEHNKAVEYIFKTCFGVSSEKNK